jgi:hypothetical protein
MKKYLLVLIIVLVFSSLLFCQTITINWIAMHGSDGTSDFEYFDGETIYCQINYSTSSMDNILGIFGRDNNTNTGSTRLHWYSDDPPTDANFSTSGYVSISNFTNSGTGSNLTANFNFVLPTVIVGSNSIQLRLGLYGEDTDENLVYSTCYMSYVARGSYTVPIGTPSSGWQSYMSYDNDTSTEAPTLDLPTSSTTITESFSLQYDQPETAFSETVRLIFTRTGGSIDNNSPHLCTLESETSGTDKTLTIDGSDLLSSTGVESISGGNALVDDAIYSVRIEYRDLAFNPVAFDTNTGVTFNDDDIINISGGDYNAGTSFSPNTDNNAFFRIQLSKTGSGVNPTIQEIEFDILGAFDATDVDALKFWKSTDNDFSTTGDNSLLFTQTHSDSLDPFIPYFNPDVIVTSTVVYYFVTVDVNSGADGLDYIGAEISAGTDITASTSISGTFPITGGTHPLPVTLSSFTVGLSGKPIINWTTQTETSNAYWNIYRGISQNMGQAIQINYGDMILGQGTVTEPTNYTYIDDFPVLESTTYYYWLECVDNAGESDLLGPVSLFIPEGSGNNGTPASPDDYGLKQNFPNPFNPDTKINFALVETGPVHLTIYNLKGEKIRTVFEGYVEADMVQSAYWDGKDENGKTVATGVYLYRLRTNSTSYTKRMLLMK